RRKALEAIGGFEAVADYLGDDYELGKRVCEAGYRVTLAGCIVDHHLPDYSFSEYFAHQLRWARTVRNSRPAGYAGLVITFGLFWAGLALILTHGAEWAVGLFLETVILRSAVAFRTGAVLNDNQLLRYLWIIPMRDLLAVAIWAGSYGGRRVVWRGTQFTLEKGKLRP